MIGSELLVASLSDVARTDVSSVYASQNLSIVSLPEVSTWKHIYIVDKNHKIEPETATQIDRKAVLK